MYKYMSAMYLRCAEYAGTFSTAVQHLGHVEAITFLSEHEIKTHDMSQK